MFGKLFLTAIVSLVLSGGLIAWLSDNKEYHEQWWAKAIAGWFLMSVLGLLTSIMGGIWTA